MNPNGLSADGDSPLAPTAHDGLRVKLVGADEVTLSEKWRSAVSPITSATFRIVGRRPLLPGLYVLLESLLLDMLLSPRINTFLQMSLLSMGFGASVEQQGLTPLLCVPECDCPGKSLFTPMPGLWAMGSCQW